MSGPWVEKYRPQKLEDVVGQKQIINRLEKYVGEKSMPNLMFTGPAGVGKTTTALALVKSILGEYWRQNFLELNASDARGIETVRNNIKNFCRLKPVGAPFRIIFLDEVDNMTKDAQHALRREMEMYTKTASFILSCNYSSKIIDPIQSRCYEMKLIGGNPRFAKYAGLKVDRTIINAMVISGAICGLVGMFEVYGLKGNYQDGISNEYYFDGLLVAMIMRYKPVGIIFMSFAFAFLKVGAMGMELNAGVPGELYRIIQSVVIFFLAAQSGVKAILDSKKKGGAGNG